MKRIKEFLKSKVGLTVISISLLIVLAIVIIIKNGPYNGKLICAYKNNTNTMKTSFKYTMDFKNKHVTNMVTEEIIESDYEDIINNYKDSVQLLLEKYKSLNYYQSKIDVKDKKLTVTTTVDYTKIDMKKYKKQEGEKVYIKNNKVIVKKLKEIYEKNGATGKYR